MTRQPDRGPAAAAPGAPGVSAGRWLLLPLAVGALVRCLYLVQMDLPLYDPWRHLQLVENLRRGLGFTLFEGQPYIWYNPGWHHLLALWPASLPLEWPATLLSIAAVPVFQRYLDVAEADHSGPRPGLLGALMLAGFGPAVAFTCHYGSEAFALLLLLTALLVGAGQRRGWTGFLSGLLFGIALTARMNLVFNVFLFLPLLRDRRRWALWGAGFTLPLLAVWVRNFGIVRSYPFVFTWDGLATRSADFDPLSTLVIQMHPALQEGLHRLHEIIVPSPEWLRDASGFRPASIVFMLTACLALVFCRKLHVALAGLSTLVYFTLFDATLSSNFFRIYLAIFPAMFIAIATIGARLYRNGGLRRWAGIGLVALTLLCGVPQCFPPRMYASENVTPPPRLLSADRYMVNSGFYHPESVMYRYGDKHFIGMPLYPSQFEEFRKHHPAYDRILWHDFNLQVELRAGLERAGHPFVDAAATPGGRSYVVMQLVSPGQKFVTHFAGPRRRWLRCFFSKYREYSVGEAPCQRRRLPTEIGNELLTRNTSAGRRAAPHAVSPPAAGSGLSERRQPRPLSTTATQQLSEGVSSGLTGVSVVLDSAVSFVSSTAIRGNPVPRERLGN